MKSLENAENVFGRLSKEVERRIKDYVADPTVDKWADISSIIIRSNFTTIWQAVLEINPSFPRKGRAYDEKGNLVQEWSEIPSPVEVLRAIKEATK